MTRKMKDSGVEWIGEIPEDWGIVKNKYIFSSKKEIVGEESKNYNLLSLTKSKGIIYRDIEDNQGKLPASFDTYQKIERYDLVLCLFDLDISAVFSDVSKIEGMISSAYNRFQIKNDYPMFYKYWFDMINDSRKYRIYSKSLRNTIDLDNFNSIFSVRPPKSQQKSIADFLDKKTQEIDNIISKTKESIEEYKKYKQSLITETVTKGLDKNVGMKDSGIEWIGEIPKHWDLIRLQSLVKLRDTKGPYNPKEDLYVGLENIESYTGKYVATDTKYEENIYTEFKSRDILFNTLRPYLTKVYYANFSGYCTSEFLVIRGYMGIKKYLFYQLINSRFVELINSSTYGSKMPRANWNFMKDIYLPLPPLKEQEQIPSYLDKKRSQIDNIISTKEKLLREMEAYKKSLIYETVTGKREVE